MKEYHVSFMCIYSDVVQAETPEEAALKVETDCPFDVDGQACVTDVTTDEEFMV